MGSGGGRLEEALHSQLARYKETGEDVAVKVRWAAVVGGWRRACIHTLGEGSRLR